MNRYHLGLFKEEIDAEQPRQRKVVCPPDRSSPLPPEESNVPS